MNADQSANPSVPTRALTMVCDNAEPGQSAIMPPASAVQAVYTTPPSTTPSKANGQQQTPASQISMRDVITIEHGEDMRSKCTIHEQILCRHSERLKKLSSRAEALREAYNSCDEDLDRIESITMADLTPEQTQEQKLGAKLLPLIMRMEKQCPLQDYQKSLSTTLRAAIDHQFTNKNLIQSAEIPKTLKLFQSVPFNKRLHLLNFEGLLEVSQEICNQLRRFKAVEGQLAKNNMNKAWAQGRLFVRGTTGKSVQSFVKWSYTSTLDYDDAEQLYDLWSLSTRLNVDALAEECMNRLYNTASASINIALSNDIPLHDLLGLCHEQNTPDSQVPSDDFVATVFRHVLKTEKPPVKLLHLVIETMAKCMDSELWSRLQHMVNHDTARKLIEMMVAHREIKVEQVIKETSSVKCESQHDLGSPELQRTRPRY